MISKQSDAGLAGCHLRIARPVADIERSVDMYCRGLGLAVLYRFSDHQGFDGAMLGDPAAQYHFEFTRCRHHVLRPSPTAEDLVAFYVADADRWEAACSAMTAAGFVTVAAFNPYWAACARTFADPDGYRVVLHRGPWSR